MKLLNVCVLIIFLVTAIECFMLNKCYLTCTSNEDCGGTCPECAALPLPTGSIKICGTSATKSSVNNSVNKLSNNGNL